MNARQKAKKYKKELEKAKKELEGVYWIDISRKSYREEQENKLKENILKMLIKRHYGSVHDTHQRIKFDKREVDFMNNFSIDIEKDYFERLIYVYIK